MPSGRLLPVVPRNEERGGPAYYFGCIVGFPPGVPGGGMTGVVPGVGSGTGAAMPGSVPAGGRITPLFRSSCSLSVSPGRRSEDLERGSCGGDFGASCAGDAANETAGAMAATPMHNTPPAISAFPTQAPNIAIPPDLERRTLNLIGRSCRASCSRA